MSDLYEVRDQPDLGSGSTGPFPGHPLVMALDGWVDAGLGATAAVASLLAQVQTEVVAVFDTDRLLDHRARRPVLRIVDGVNTSLSWPELQLRAGRDGAGHPLLALLGPEPDHEWGAFCGAVLELAHRLGAGVLVGLGAFPAPVPHTRPTSLAATASSAELAARVGFLPGTLDVPAGVQAALEHRFAEAGYPAVGLWARVPHYAAAMPYPEASALLLEGLADLLGLALDTTELRNAALSHRQRLDQLIENSDEHQALVRQLEEQFDAHASAQAGPGGATDLGGRSFGTPGLGGTGFGTLGRPLPSGDEIAAELERFLQGEGGER